MPDEVRALPVWKDFRARYVDEDETKYRVSKAEFDLQQLRSRDHFLANNDTAILTLHDLLRRDLMGDGTALRRGILNELADRQKEMAAEQAKMPETVKAAIRESELMGKAQEWTATKKWIWGTAGASIAAILGTLAYLIVVHFH